MSTHKHTPGPWKTTKEVTRNQFVTDTKIRSADDSVVCVLHCNSEANARLIAAAPELLNMLEKMLYEAREGSVCPCTMEHAEKAIAKARGTL